MKLTKDTLIEGKIVKAGADVKIIENNLLSKLNTKFPYSDFSVVENGKGDYVLTVIFDDGSGGSFLIENDYGNFFKVGEILEKSSLIGIASKWLKTVGSDELRDLILLGTRGMI